MAEIVSLASALGSSIDILLRASSQIQVLIRRWREAPKRMIYLGSEIDHMRQVLLHWQELCNDENARLKSRSLIEAMRRQIYRIRPVYEELVNVLQELDARQGRSRKQYWMMHCRKVEAIQIQLRTLRLDSAEIIQIFANDGILKIQTAFDDFTRSMQNNQHQRSCVTPPIVPKIQSCQGPATFLTHIPLGCGHECLCRCHWRKKQDQLRLAPLWGILGSFSGICFGRALDDLCSSCMESATQLLEVGYTPPTRMFRITFVAQLRSSESQLSFGLTIRPSTNIIDAGNSLNIISLAKTQSLDELQHAITRRRSAVRDVYYKDGFSALHVAALHGSLEMVKFLLLAGANPFLEDWFGVPAIFLCYQRILRGNDSPAATQDLLAYLPCDDFYDDYDFSHIQRVVLGIRPLNLDQELSNTRHRKEIKKQDRMGMTPLHWAAMRKDVVALNSLLTAGAQVDIQDKRGITPLYEACQSNSDECVKKLLAHGADIKLCYKLGYNAFHAAVTGNASRALLRRLLHAGADINDANNVFAVTPLARAVAYQNHSCCDNLLKMGADKDSHDCHGNTPLLTGVFYNSHACVDLLISHGCDVSAVTNRGETLLHRAAKRGDERTYSILAAANLKGLDANAKDECAKTGAQYFYLRSAVPLSTIDAFEALLKCLDPMRTDTQHGGVMDDCENDDFHDAVEEMS